MGRLEHEWDPVDHLVRGIAGVLDLSWVRGELASYYSPLGRPSIDATDDQDAHRRLCFCDRSGCSVVRFRSTWRTGGSAA
jgi:hypothetical protein